MVDIRRDESGIIHIGDKVRIEAGPRIKTAEATKELLDDTVTASHYQPPRRATREELDDPAILTEGKDRLFLDALGKPIQLGEQLTYVDWLAPADEHVFNVYTWGERPDYDPDKHPQREIWNKVDIKDTELEAIGVAIELAKE